MKKLIILLVLFISIAWLFVKPSAPTYIEVTGKVIDIDSNLPLSDANVEISRFFNDGTLWVLLRWGYRQETVSVKTDPSGQFRFPKIIKDSRMGKKLWTGDIRVSKEGYVPFDQEIVGEMPTENYIQLRKKYSGQKLPQGTIRSDLPQRAGEIYINFAANGLIKDNSEADLIVIYKEVKRNEISKQSSSLGYGSFTAESVIITGELRSQGKGGIAIAPIRQAGDLVSAFEELGDCSELNYKDYIEHPGPAVYCVRTKDGHHFAKILLRWGDHITWVYQPSGAPDVRTELTKLEDKM